jgi:uncharacterized repeat protein (TIGR04042 family)
MPEVWVSVEWPDGTEEVCYSPSTVVEQYLAPGARYRADDFLARARVVWNLASERVEAIFGARCSRADAQLRAIEARLARFEDAAEVTVLRVARKPP